MNKRVDPQVKRNKGKRVDDASSLTLEHEQIQSKIISSLSHDLKTPLSVIIGSLEIIECVNKKLSEERKSTLLKVALHEAHRLDRFVTNILDIAKLENGMVKVKWENLEIGTLIQSCLTQFKSRLGDSKVTFKLKSTPVNVLSDAVLLKRVLILLLDNAVKYGGNPSEIKISYGKNKDNFCHIDVEDNGHGISESIRKIVFSKSARLENEDKQNAGTGLGLAIGKMIMELIHGDLSIADHSAAGAQLIIRFPCANDQKSGRPK